jgi:hypothetical protein
MGINIASRSWLLGSDFAIPPKFSHRNWDENPSATSQIVLQLPVAQFDILYSINGVDMKWYDNIGLGHIASRSWLLAQILLCFPNFATENYQNLCAMSQIGLQLPVAQFDILCSINGVDMKWYDNIGLGHIASRSWLLADILL